MKKKIAHFFLLFIIAQSSNAQTTEPLKKWSYSFGLGYLQSIIKNKNINEDEALRIKNEAGPYAEFHFFYPIKPSLSFFTGLNFSRYSTVSKSNGIFKAFSLKRDIDGYEYYPVVETSFSERRNITFFSLPIGFKKVFQPENNASAFFEAGFLTNYTVKATIVGEGTLEKKGMYLDDRYSNVYHILESVPRLGYVEVLKNETNEIPISIVNFSYFFSLGFKIAATDKTDLFFKGYYNASLVDIIKKDEQKKDYQEVSGELDPYKKTTVSSMGIILGLNF
jgi:Outer membrane protein beta-barrel domain